MTRTVNEDRPRELREAIVRYLVTHGLAGLSLRPLAKAVGSSPRVLLYYFGSKEKIVMQALAEVRLKQRAAYGAVAADSFAQECWIIWKRMSAPDSEPLFRLFFEVYGLALRQPKLYKAFLHSTIEDWLQLMASQLLRQGFSLSEARALGTIVIAGLRGFMLDYCTTHDRKRIDHAVAAWLDGFNTLSSDLKRKGVK
ncbi:MAG TPA: TetR/AcrR family transcriptional regulator [Terriglobales bacterium]|nr:TetR/AcrR family transcriptional regulator [Terriglobales bacterium]